MDSTKQLRRGIGTVAEVAIEHANLPSEEVETVISVKNLASSLGILSRSATGNHAARAVIAAFLNQGFRKAGGLWSVSETGHIQQEYISSDNARQVIADLMGLPEPAAKG